MYDEILFAHTFEMSNYRIQMTDRIAHNQENLAFRIVVGDIPHKWPVRFELVTHRYPNPIHRRVIDLFEFGNKHLFLFAKPVFASPSFRLVAHNLYVPSTKHVLITIMAQYTNYVWGGNDHWDWQAIDMQTGILQPMPEPS